MIDCDCETDGSFAALLRTQRAGLTLVTRTAVTTRDWSQVLCPKKGFQPFSHLYDLMIKCVRTSGNGKL